MKNYYIIIFVVLLIGGGLFWFLQPSNSYETISPTIGKVVQAVYANGEVEPVYWSKISTQIPGKIDNIYVNEGESVKRNDPLAKLEDSVEHAKASELLSHLSYLEHELERYKMLVENDHTSKSKYESIKSEYETAKAQINTQNEIVNRMIIKSPIDGVVLKRNVEQGEMANSGDVIFWVGKLTPLRITANVDEEDIPLVQVGQHVLIKADAFPNENMEGEILEITPKGDPIDKNFRVRVSLLDDTPLMIGMTVEINIITKEQEGALLVPSESVVDGKVWILNGKEIVEKTVVIGITSEKYTQIIDGVITTDKILLNPIEYLTKK